jgi:hypothetical protein
MATQRQVERKGKKGPQVEREWISAAAVTRILGIDNTARKVRELAGRGLIATREIPGCAVRYRAADAYELAQKYIRPAARSEPLAVA